MPARKWGSEQLVNTTTAGNQLASDVTALKGGGFVVVWQHTGITNSEIRAQRYDALGNRVGGETTIAAVSGNDQLAPSVAGLADGGFYVTWTQRVGADNYILGNVYNASGGLVRAQPVVFAQGLDTDSDVASYGTGGSIVVWNDPDKYGGDTAFRTFDAAGTGSAIERAFFATQTQKNSSVATSPDGSGYAAVTEQNGAIQLRVRQGIIGSTQAIAFDTSLPVSNPNVAWSTNNTFAATWSEAEGALGYGISMQIFHVNGLEGNPFVYPTNFTNTISVNSTRIGDQINPQIAGLPGGGFVVSWVDNSGLGADASASSIRLQAFYADGGKMGGEITVNTTTAGFQIEPSITALSDGRVVVTWTDVSATGGDVSGASIRSQIVDPRDGIVTGTSAADTLYGNKLVADEISGYAGNDFLIGLKGDDALYGGEGNDTLRGMQGEDDLDGGSGIDTADYRDSGKAVTVNLATGVGEGGRAEGDELVSIENVYGGSGSDTLIGSNAANTLYGGVGADTLTGAGGADWFQYNAAGESTVAAGGQDVLTQFIRAEGDKVYLSPMDANAGTAANDTFVFRGTAAFTGVGQVRYEQSGGNTFIYANVSGDLNPEMGIRVTGLIAFQATDFIL